MYVCFFSVVAMPSYAANNVIDVLVVYTKGVADTYSGDPTTRINQLFQVTNQIYLDSGVDVEIRVANTLMVDYTDENSAYTALSDITYNSNPAFAGVAAAREAAKADMVIFYRPYSAALGTCGLAWVGGMGSDGSFANPKLKDFMFAHIAINSCGDYVTAHELGHNMGLRHSRKQDGKGATLDYALGHGVENKFTDIMAYQGAFNVDYWEGKVYKFSNPELTCKGLPCGVDRNDIENGADASYALNITAPQIAGFFIAEPNVEPVDPSVTPVDPSIVVDDVAAIVSNPEIANAKSVYETALAAENNNKQLVAEQSAQITALDAAIGDASQSISKAQAAYESAAYLYASKQNQMAALNIQVATASTAYYRAKKSAKKAALATYNNLLGQYNIVQSDAAQLLGSLNEAKNNLTVATDNLARTTDSYLQAKEVLALLSEQVLPLQIASARALAVYRNVQAEYEAALLASI